jgi:hypothetical protein
LYYVKRKKWELRAGRSGDEDEVEAAGGGVDRVFLEDAGATGAVASPEDGGIDVKVGCGRGWELVVVPYGGDLVG